MRGPFRRCHVKFKITYDCRGTSKATKNLNKFLCVFFFLLVDQVICRLRQSVNLCGKMAKDHLLIRTITHIDWIWLSVASNTLITSNYYRNVGSRNANFAQIKRCNNDELHIFICISVAFEDNFQNDDVSCTIPSLSWSFISKDYIYAHYLEMFDLCI